MSQKRSVVNVSDYFGAMKKWFLVVAGLAALGAVAGFLLFQLRSSEFTAESRVQIKPIVSQSDAPNLDIDRQINTSTEKAVASSGRVAELSVKLLQAAELQASDDLSSAEVSEAASAIADVDSAVVRDVLEKVDVEVRPDSQILVFTANAASEDRAIELAQSVAVAYLDFRESEESSARLQARENLAAREAVLVEELEEILPSDEEVIDGTVKSEPYDVISKKRELEEIGSKFANLEAGTVDPGVILLDARVPNAGGIPPLAAPLLGALLGASVGFAIALLLDRQDDRLRNPEAELAAIGAPLLGTAPVSGKRKSGMSLFATNTSGGDAYRRVQGSLSFNLDEDNKSLVLVAGVEKGTSTPFVASNLAATAARSGRRTVLVGANLRDNTLHDGPGLSDVIAGKVSLSAAIQHLDYVDTNLFLLGAGTIDENPADILQSESFSRLISAVGAEYDLVMVEAPPILQVADAVDIAKMCDGTVIVAESGVESRSEIAQSVNQIRNVGSDVVGVVVAENSRS